MGIYVELALASIIATQFGKKNAQTAINGFLSVENMRTKVRYADTILFSLNLPTEHRADWVKLIERAGKLATKPWLIGIPGTALFALVLSVNLLGDGVRDVTAPEGRN